MTDTPSAARPSPRLRARLRRTLTRGIACVAGTLLAVGCLYDPDDRCGPGERVENDFCVCIEGMVQSDVGCEPCGQHATAVAGVCECDDGYARTTPEEPCEEVSASLGQTCDPGATDPSCPTDFPFCQPSSFDGGYCTTSDCSTNEDCSGGYVCDDRVSPSYCARPPVGLEQPCTTHEDCAGTEATYCVTIMSGGCAIEGCSAPDVGCPPTYSCCDLSSFGLTVICVPEGMCPN